MAGNRGRDIDESSSVESDEEENTHNSKENFSQEQVILSGLVMNSIILM
jgi:hypothetical protein